MWEMSGFEFPLGNWASTFLVAIFSVLLIHRYLVRNYDYWKKRNVLFVKPVPFFGTTLEGFTKPLHDIEYERYLAYGPIYGHFEGSTPILSVADPAILREILVKDFQFFTCKRPFSSGDEVIDNMLSVLRGEDWKRVRSIVTPTFSTGKIKRVLNIFKDCSRTLVQNFKKAVDERVPVDAKRVYGAFTMDVIASSAFSTKIDSHNNPDNEFVEMAGRVFTRHFNWRFAFLILAPRLMKLLGISIFAGGTSEFFKRITCQIIEERKRTEQVRNDFLQLLIDTAKEDVKLCTEDKDSEDTTSNYGIDNVNRHIFKAVTSKNLSMDELIAQCVAFFLAGYDTTASTLSFATYFLALNPNVQDKLRAEVDEAIKDSNGEITYEAVQSMKYLDNIISETLRLYPPAIRTERFSDVDYKLRGTGLTIQKGTIVTIPIYAIHRDPKFFPNPENFDPNRFRAEERAKRDQYVYMPFGAGPRNCIGMRFALVEIKVCLAYVISNFIIKRCSQTKVPLEFYLGQGILQPKEIFIEIEPRNHSSLIK